MKRLGLWLRLGVGVVFTLMITNLQSCGDPQGRSGRYEQKSSNQDVTQMTFHDSEYVVQVLLSPEKVSDQDVSDAEFANWRSSLVPASTLETGDHALKIDNDGLALVQDAVRASGGESANDTDIREQTDLRSFDTPVKNQGSRPWCTAFATIAAVENLGKQFFTSELDLSEIHHFRSYQVYQTPPSLSAGKNQGFIDESQWPYYGSKKTGGEEKVRAKLSSTTKIQLNLSDVVASIRSGHPVVINLNVNGSFMRPKTGGIIMPGGVGQGGHAIALTGVVLDSRIEGGGYFVIKNSWGTSWGDHGYGYLPFTYCKYSYCYAWSINDINVNDDQGKPREKSPSVEPLPSPSPMPSPVPVPAPVPEIDSEIMAESFNLKPRIMDYRGLFGAHFFILGVDGRPEALDQLQSIVYRVDGARNFRVVMSGASASVEATQSRAYKIWSGTMMSGDATVYLKDGRSFELKQVKVNL